MSAWLWVMMVGLVIGITVAASAGAEEDPGLSARRANMVAQLRKYGIQDERVLEVMGRIPRHRFIPAGVGGCDPYGDHPCPIGHGQTISQPFIVAYMTARMNVQPGERVLEVGTGSGYQAAVLAALGAEVFSVEIVPALGLHAANQFRAQGLAVHARVGDGYQGWAEEAPFDVIMVTCAPDAIPEGLVHQLRDGGRMVLPLGDQVQQLVVLRKRDGRVETEADLPVRFVPMVRGVTGRAAPAAAEP